MTMTLVVVLAVAFVSSGVLLDRLWIRYGARNQLQMEPTNPLPAEIPQLSPDQRATIELIQKEWNSVLQLQMHFNDLGLRFRAMTLTAFGAFVGAAVAIGQLAGLSDQDRQIVLLLPIAFWVAAGVLDLGYYHRLLLGAVAQAAKFDNHATLRQLGLFGLTSAVGGAVRPFTVATLVILYYLVPLVSVGSLVAWRMLRPS